MLTIIHGSDTAASRKFFLNEKQKYPGAIILDAEKINLTDLAQLFQGGGLFGETKYLFIEQFLTKRKKSSDYKEIISYLESSAVENMICLWENKELEIGTLKAMKNPVIKAFKLPQTLFQLLDELKPGNGKRLLSLFHQTIETAEPEMVFFMLVRQIRLLLALSSTTSLRGETTKQSLQNRDRHANARDDETAIDELKRMQPWQKTKLQKQAELFQSEELLNLYQTLYQLEEGQKTGTLTLPLVSAIDFLLLEV